MGTIWKHFLICYVLILGQGFLCWGVGFLVSGFFWRNKDVNIQASLMLLFKMQKLKIRISSNKDIFFINFHNFGVPILLVPLDDCPK